MVLWHQLTNLNSKRQEQIFIQHKINACSGVTFGTDGDADADGTSDFATFAVSYVAMPRRIRK